MTGTNSGDDGHAGWLASIGHLKSRERYERRLTIVLQWLAKHGLHWSTATSESLQIFLDEQSTNERSAMRTVLKSFFGYLHREGQRADDPSSAIATVAALRRSHPRELSEKDVAQFLSELSNAAASAKHSSPRLALTRTAALCELAYSSGVGAESLARLMTSDFTVGAKQPSILILANDGSRRRIPVTVPAASAISRWLEVAFQSFGRNGTVLFHGLKPDVPRTASDFSKDIQRYQSSMKTTSVTLGGLRHAFIVHMLRRGFDEAWLAYILGFKGMTALEDRFPVPEPEAKIETTELH